MGTFISFDHDSGMTYIGFLEKGDLKKDFQLKDYAVLPRRILEERMMKKEEKGFYPTYFEACKKYWTEGLHESNRGKNIQIDGRKGLVHFLRDLDEKNFDKE